MTGPCHLLVSRSKLEIARESNSRMLKSLGFLLIRMIKILTLVAAFTNLIFTGEIGDTVASESERFVNSSVSDIAIGERVASAASSDDS